ncbi:hypothetical protein [Algoriphagus sp. A40]|uniref:hypothetical protein n=1 Tax=Algoriphagus sp. A40 TaxID=1945863 RepID=UPI00143979D9|nr:hypothetical protein [Algoriphagus sp. A40]
MDFDLFLPWVPLRYTHGCYKWPLQGPSQPDNPTIRQPDNRTTGQRDNLVGESVEPRRSIEPRQRATDIRHPTSDIRNPTSDIQHPKSDIRNPTSEIRNPTSHILHLLTINAASKHHQSSIKVASKLHIV